MLEGGFAMKSVFTWLVDPYVLVLSIGMLLVWLSMHSKPMDLGETPNAPGYCATCQHSHIPGSECAHVPVGAIVVYRGE